MEFGLHSQPPVSNLFSPFQDAVAFHGASNHASSICTYRNYIYKLYIYNTRIEFGFYPQPPVSNLFSLFQDAVAFHGAPKDSNHGFSIHIPIICINIYIYIQHAHGLWVIFAASSLKSVFAFSRCGRAPRCAERLKQWI